MNQKEREAMDLKKIKDALSVFSQKSADFARESVEKLTERATEFSILNKAKMELKGIEHRLEEAMEELGGEFYDLYTTQSLQDVNEQLKAQIEKIRELKKQLAAKETELQELYQKYGHETIDKEKIKTLKKELEEGGGTIEQIVITENSPVVGKKLKNVKLPKEVLVGTILRNEEVIIPDGMFSFAVGDYVTLLGKKADVQEAIQILNPPQEEEKQEEKKEE